MVRALRAHGVGRPRSADVADAMDPLTRSRHDLELLFPRRAEQYRSMAYLGTVADHALSVDVLPELAEEFRQIGDTEGARDLLQEVIAKASGPLKSKAQGMLDELA